MNNVKRTAATIATAIALSASLPAMSNNDDKSLTLDVLQRGLVEGDTAFLQDKIAPNYIQHNPGVADGLDGLLGAVEYLQTLENPITITPARVLQQDDLVVVHSQYEWDGPKAVFDLFRVANGKLVEHWDAVQEIPASTASGRGMIDGPTEISDIDMTASNKEQVTNFVTDILMKGEGDKLPRYIGNDYHQHNPGVEDGIEGLGKFMAYLADNKISFGYRTIHNVVAEGNFVFTQSEGDFGGQATAFYDLFRVDNGLIVEHWDVIQAIPSEMVHSNGMF